MARPGPIMAVVALAGALALAAIGMSAWSPADAERSTVPASAAAEPTPYPLPPGASPLVLRTAAPGGPVAGEPQLCPMIMIGPVRVTGGLGGIGYVDGEGNSTFVIAWPRGFSGRRLAGRVEIVSPDGDVIARDGDVLVGLDGSSWPPDAFEVCSVTGYFAPAPGSPAPGASAPPRSR